MIFFGRLGGVPRAETRVLRVTREFCARLMGVDGSEDADEVRRSDVLADGGALANPFVLAVEGNLVEGEAVWGNCSGGMSRLDTFGSG